METPEFAACPCESRRSVAVANREGGDALFARVDRIEQLTEMERLVERMRDRETANRLAASRWIRCGLTKMAQKCVTRADVYATHVERTIADMQTASSAPVLLGAA